MVKRVTNTFRKEGELLSEAAKTVLKTPGHAASKVKNAGIAFREGSLTTQMTVIGGVSGGVTLALQGVRNIHKGLQKDEDGKRHLGMAAVGAAELVGGGFVAHLFYERLKLSDNSCDKGPSVG